MVHAASEHRLPGPQDSWSAIVPLRSLATGKSRLRTQLADEVVEDLVREVAAALLRELAGSTGVARILVVSDTDLSGELTASTGADLVETLVQSPGGGLNEAVAEAVGQIWAEAPASPLLVIHADLPYVTSAEVEQLLAQVEALGQDAFIADHTGRGSTVIALQPGSFRRAAFGAESAARHAASGFAEIQLPQRSGLRHDLDTPEHYLSYRQRRRSLPGSPGGDAAGHRRRH